MAMVCSSQIERRDKTRHENAAHVTSNGNFEPLVIEDSRWRDTFAGARAGSEKGAEQGSTLSVLPKAIRSFHPKRHPGFSPAEWNLAAVHRPLQAIRNAPTIRPALQVLAVRQRPFASERARC